MCAKKHSVVHCTCIADRACSHLNRFHKLTILYISHVKKGHTHFKSAGFETEFK